MKIEVIASGSSGNVTSVRGEALLLIDCGKPYKWTMSQLNYELPDAILVTHEHGDHAKAVKQFLSRQVDIYATLGTITALKLEPQWNLHEIEVGVEFEACGIKILPIESEHDAAEPVNFILSDESDRVLFVTDTGAIPKVDGEFTKIFIEANYDTRRLMWSETAYHLQERILQNHLSIEVVEEFLKRYPAAEVTLIHVSKRHGDEEEFYKRIEVERQ